MENSPTDLPQQDALSLGLALPDTFLVSVIMEKRPSVSPWAQSTWDAIGVAADSRPASAEPEKIFQQGELEHLRYSGFRLRLYKDECERYYHNLMSPTPRCFVVATKTDHEAPKPYLVTLDFDEAHAYEEGDANVFPVDIPPELYRWCEAFVLENYVQEKKYKRKLKNWSAPAAEQDT